MPPIERPARRGRTKRRLINGELLALAPTREWHPNLIRLVTKQFDTTLKIIEPTVSPFAANQQSVAQIWEAVRRASDVEIARRVGSAIDTCGGGAPGAKMNAAIECHLDGRASPEPCKPQGNASP